MRKIKPLRSVLNLLKIYRNKSLLKVEEKFGGKKADFKLKIASFLMNSKTKKQ